MWEDEFFSTLTATQKLLFIYYITNDNIGLTGKYEITDRQTSFDTGLTQTQITDFKTIFHTAGKIHFYKNWVYVVNATKLNGYSGEKLEKATSNELEDIPSDVNESLDTLSIGYQEVSTIGDTPINHKSEIINHKSKDRGIVKGDYSDINSLQEEDFEKIAEKYQTTLAFVRSKYDDMLNWNGKNPLKNKYANYYSGLLDWVKKDAMERRENAAGKSKIAYAGDTL